MIRSRHAGSRQTGGFSLNVFNDDELEDIHLATLEVLQRTGVFVGDDEAMEIYEGAGAIVDRKTKVVKIPPLVVEEAIQSVPSKFIACGRTPKNDVVLERNRVTFTNFGEGIKIIDPYTGEHRDTVKADTANAARLVDYLDNLDTYERIMASHDAPQATIALHNAEASLTNTSKHHWLGPVNGYCTRKIVDILAAIVGSKDTLRERPLMTFVTCPGSPLTYSKEHCEILIEAARCGLGVNIVSMTMAGGSAPDPGRHPGGIKCRSPGKHCPQSAGQQRLSGDLWKFHLPDRFVAYHGLGGVAGMRHDYRRCRSAGTKICHPLFCGRWVGRRQNL